MSAAYPVGSVRYDLATLLAKHQQATPEFLKQRLQQHRARDVTFSLRGLKQAGLVEQSANDGRYRFTTIGLDYWHHQQMAAANDPAPAPVSPRAVLEQPCPIYHPPELLKRGVVRLPGNTGHLPMAYRPGALDFKACARIDGPWRIHPDGRKESLHG